MIGLTPTDLANYTYCPRLFKLSKTFQERTAPSTYTVWGLFEHDAFRTTCNLLNKTMWKDLSRDSLVATTHIDTGIGQSLALVQQNYPQFTVGIERHIPELRYRMNLWLREKIASAERIVAKYKSEQAAMAVVLPWKVEDKLASKELQIYGRTDALYNDGRALIPEDIKTHDGRFTTFIHHESHRAQLLCYSVMAEEKYGIPSKESRIFFSKDLSYSTFAVTQDDKAALKIKVQSARLELVDDKLPPKLTGSETIKCSCCYLRELCNKAEQKKQPDPASEWLEKLTSSTDSKMDSLQGAAA